MALDRAKTSFFSNVSRASLLLPIQTLADVRWTADELRTPLTLILGPLDDVLSTRKDNLLREDRERLNTVNRHAKRLLTMVNKLLDFSSLEGGRMNFKFRKVQIVRPIYSFLPHTGH
jgi:signal transduction histidine kinase